MSEKEREKRKRLSLLTNKKEGKVKVGIFHLDSFAWLLSWPHVSEALSLLSVIRVLQIQAISEVGLFLFSPSHLFACGGFGIL